MLGFLAKHKAQCGSSTILVRFFFPLQSTLFTFFSIKQTSCRECPGGQRDGMLPELFAKKKKKKNSALCQRGLKLPLLRRESAAEQPSVIPADKSQQVHSGRQTGKCLNQISGHTENYNSKSLQSLGLRNKLEAKADLGKAQKIPVAETSMQRGSGVTACPFSYLDSSERSEKGTELTHKLFHET